MPGYVLDLVPAHAQPVPPALGPVTVRRQQGEVGTHLIGGPAWAGSTEPMTRSMNRPMARIPAPCMRRLLSGGLPHASGKVSRTAVQYSSRAAQMPAKSVSPLLRLR